jgi:dihydrodipicolinate synthase/N-acetylneuraminate lyase
MREKLPPGLWPGGQHGESPHLGQHPRAKLPSKVVEVSKGD